MRLTYSHFYNPKYCLYSKPIKGLQGYGVSYRFGFNGQEKDDEVSGTGNTMAAEFWEYEARLGRRWNCDPIDKPWMSSYHAFSNKPIWKIDPNGANDGIYLVDEETGNKTKVSNQGDKEGYDIIHTGKVNADGSMSAKNTSSTVLIDKGITETLEKNGKKFDPEYRTYNFSDETNRAVVNIMLTATLTYMTGGVLGGLPGGGSGLLSSVGTYGEQALLRGGIEFSAQLAVNGGDLSKVDIADVGMATFFNPKYSVLMGSLVDYKAFSNNEDKLQVTGINKSFTKTGIDLGVKYAFGGMGAGLKVQTILKKLDAPQLNFLFMFPANISGKLTSKLLKDATDE